MFNDILRYYKIKKRKESLKKVCQHQTVIWSDVLNVPKDISLVVIYQLLNELYIKRSMLKWLGIRPE